MAHRPETQEAIGYVGEVGIDTTYEDLPCGTKLYTTPPSRKWVGLSDEEIDAIFPLGDDVDVLDVARGIEAKLREKNG